MSTASSVRMEASASGNCLKLAGHVRREAATRLVAAFAGERAAGRAVALDLSAVESLDSAVVATLLLAHREAKQAGAPLRVVAPSEGARRSLAMFRVRDAAKPEQVTVGLAENLGDQLVERGRSLRELLQLIADASGAVLALPLRRASLRPGALAEQAIDIGSQALPIVALIAFLVGLTLAFQSAYQLRQFGAAVLVANLTGVAIVREMGPLMTAILVAGRSGSSIAAEISTMKVSEEIDGLLVMGIDPIGYLAVPRLLAITLTLPLLTVLADLAGIVGGFLVGILYLDISFVAFGRQLIDALSAGDLLTGLVKSLAFAWGIGIVGLFYGFRVRGGAAEVGRATTASVVASIFYIIVADCFFSVLFYVVL